MIETSIGKAHYDYLVVATGASTNFYGMKDIESNSMSMKTIEDADPCAKPCSQEHGACVAER
ncbi:MAG: hypothetical protein WDN75_21525 [Bacteroidota bacterium]